MFTDLTHTSDCTWLSEKIRVSAAITPALMSAFVAGACARLATLNNAGQPALHICTFLRNSAWTDAALALADIELPGWKLRRLVQDDVIWMCSLSRQPLMPIEFDDTADGFHECMPLAILSAILQAQMRPHQGPVTATPRAGLATPAEVMCCDNFA